MKAPRSKLVSRILADRRLAKEFMAKVIMGGRSEENQYIEVDGKRYQIRSAPAVSPENKQ